MRYTEKLLIMKKNPIMNEEFKLLLKKKKKTMNEEFKLSPIKKFLRILVRL